MPTLSLVELTQLHYRNHQLQMRDTQKTNKVKNLHTIAAHRCALFDFFQTWRDGRGGLCHHCTHNFSRFH